MQGEKVVSVIGNQGGATAWCEKCGKSFNHDTDDGSRVLNWATKHAKKCRVRVEFR